MRPEFDELVNRRGTCSLKWDVAEGELPMWVADMDFRTAPEIVDAIVAKVSTGVLGYTEVPPEYAESVASWWRRRHGLEIDPAWVTLTTGTVPAVSSIVRSVTEPGDRVVLTTPVYNVFFASIRNSGRTVATSRLTRTDAGYAMDWDDLERRLADPRATLMILCNPQNPTGTVWDRETLARLGELCDAHGVLVLSDEVHCDLTAPGVEYTPFASASQTCARISVSCLAPTKAFNLAGLQTASVVVPDPELRATVVRGLNRDEVAEPNIIAVEATIAAFTRGEPWLAECRAYLHANRRHATSAINAIAGVVAEPGEATYLLWIDVAGLGIDSTVLVDHIRRTTGLVLSDGASYDPEDTTHLRMNLACPRARLDDGLARLRAAIDALVPDTVASPIRTTAEKENNHDS